MNTPTPKYVYIASLGCPKNFVDTEVIAGSLVTHQIGLTGDAEEADLYLINTCAFIPPARKEAEQVIIEAVDWKSNEEGRKIIVTGCLIQWDSQGHFREMYGDVDLWLGIDEVEHVGEHIIELLRGAEQTHPGPNDAPDYIYDDLTPRLQLTLPHFSYIKISEGCNNHCSYCSIPGIRGALRSRSVASVCREAENLINSGVRELILIAQDTTAFGKDNPEQDENIVSLLRQLDRLQGDNHWIRMLYTHPASFTDDLINAMRLSNHILPYVDIPLQHISDPILDCMGRRVSKQQIRELISKLRSALPDIVLRTTFLLGYPGETDEHFQELCEFVKEQQFDRLGVFPYFPEPGTKAAELPNQVDPEVAEERCELLMDLQAEISLKKNQQLVGKVFDVIIDTVEDGSAIGRTYMDAPEIDQCVNLEDVPDDLAGEIVSARIDEVEEYTLYASLVD